MSMNRRSFLLATAAVGLCAVASTRHAAAAERVLDITTPMPAPDWALLERAVLDAHVPACEAFYNRYFDTEGRLLIKVRWGTLDGPDDAIENVNDWPQVYQLGGSERVRELYERAYEGHIRMYTEAKTNETALGREGMYYREFPPTIDMQHLGEGLSVFNLMGLGNPYSKAFRDRTRRFAGFFTGEDPIAKNYDKVHKIIRSGWIGSRGPLMRKTTPLDWTGDKFDMTGFAGESVKHGETTYPLMLDHFPEYSETMGDHPQNLEATSLATNAYMLAQEEKYRAWVIEYVDAWIDRAKHNNNIIPTNIGLDGSIGGETGGKWYGGFYGWAFSPLNKVTGQRADRNRIEHALIGFYNAYLLTGDDKYLDVWRKQSDAIDANAKMVNGVMSSPWMHNDQGWYSFKPGKWRMGAQDIYMLSMKPSDRARTPAHPFFLYLEGKSPNYPVEALRNALTRIHSQLAEITADQTTPDLRLADSVMDSNPASVSELLMLMQGGIHVARPGWAIPKLSGNARSPEVGASLQFSRLRYFNPKTRRPGIPPDVAALVQSLTDQEVVVTLVNLHPTESREVTIQGGAYGEHQIITVSDGTTTAPVNARSFDVGIFPGAGARLTIRQKRFSNRPTLSYPWDSVKWGNADSHYIDSLAVPRAIEDNKIRIGSENDTNVVK